MIYHSHRDVEITDTYFSGGKLAVLPTLIRSISAILREDRDFQRFYIGKASGRDYWQALTRRVDDYKITSGVSRMYLMYQSTSQANVLAVEAALEQWFRSLRPDSILNRTGGGGGRHGRGPLYFVYLAVVPRSY